MKNVDGREGDEWYRGEKGRGKADKKEKGVKKIVEKEGGEA